MAMSLVLVSCKKDDYEKPAATPTEEPDPEPDWSKFNITPYTWTLTQLQSEGLSDFIANMINQALASGNLYANFTGSEGGLETEYAGWEMHVLYNANVVLTFNVDSYNPNTQKIVISNTTATYSGDVSITADTEKVYMSVATSSTNSEQTFTIMAYIPMPEK